jgi:hypothetical protein
MRSMGHDEKLDGLAEDAQTDWIRRMTMGHAHCTLIAAQGLPGLLTREIARYVLSCQTTADDDPRHQPGV